MTLPPLGCQPGLVGLLQPAAPLAGQWTWPKIWALLAAPSTHTEPSVAAPPASWCPYVHSHLEGQALAGIPLYPRPKSREEALAWIAWNQRLYREHGIGLWLLTLRATGEFVGDCGLTPQQVDGVTELEVGYHVRLALQGRGLPTEAAAACRDYARDVVRIDRLIAIIDPRNPPSQRVAEKLGLVVERDSDNHGRWPSPELTYPASLRQHRAAGWP